MLNSPAVAVVARKPSGFGPAGSLVNARNRGAQGCVCASVLPLNALKKIFMSLHAELRVVDKRVKVVEVTSLWRIQGRGEESKGESQFFVDFLL